MGTSQLYHSLMKQIRQLQVTERITRLRTLSWIITGIFLARSVHLSRIANHILGPAKRDSKTKRLNRWLKNGAVRVRGWYEPIARALLATAAQHGAVRLLADGTKVGGGHRLLMIAVAYRRRALPLVWTWVRDQRGLSSSHKQCALLAYLQGLLPAEAEVVFVGDSEFASTAVKRLLERWHWGYVVRHKGDHLVQLDADEPWGRFDALLEKAGQKRWATNVRLTKSHAHRGHILAYWRRGEKTPWLLATNLSDPVVVARLYSRRMWIEELFGDLKKHGFDLEQTRLRHVMRLSRLTLAAALLYVWLVAFGSYAIKRGWRKLVDRTDRRDLSIFRIGYDLIERFLTLQQSIRLRWVPYFETVR